MKIKATLLEEIRKIFIHLYNLSSKCLKDAALSCLMITPLYIDLLFYSTFNQWNLKRAGRRKWLFLPGNYHSVRLFSLLIIVVGQRMIAFPLTIVHLPLKVSHLLSQRLKLILWRRGIVKGRYNHHRHSKISWKEWRNWRKDCRNWRGTKGGETLAEGVRKEDAFKKWTAIYRWIFLN